MSQSLVPVPWQPWYFLTPDTLARLQVANGYAGHEITLVDAWRSWVLQNGFWVARQNYLYHGGPYAPPASNPDTGQRNHMRGGAVDIAYPTPENRAAMLRAGFTPDPDEPWHFNNPNWPNMPIIPTNTWTAGGGSVPIVVEEPDLKQALAFQDLTTKKLAPGASSVYMRTKDNKADQNVAGAAGIAEFFLHVYASGTPGDIVEVVLVWENIATKPTPSAKMSPHYTERLPIDDAGQIKATVPFSRQVAPGDLVYLRLTPPATNKGVVTVSVVGVETNTSAKPK
jgi:hypothetical protein